MNIIEQQIWVGLAVLCGGALIMGVTKMIISNVTESFRSLKEGQRKIGEQCQAIAVTLRGFEERFKTGDQWMEMHHAEDLRQFNSLNDQARDLREAIHK